MTAYGTGANPDVTLNDVSHHNYFMQVYPSFVVTWDVPDPVRGDSTETSMRMSQDDLEAFIRILRFNNVEEFHVKRENLNGIDV